MTSRDEGAADAVFVSPHLDDAALSCAGGIARLTRAGARVVVATVFTADAAEGAALSPAARRNHMRWGAGDAPFERRRREDEAAMRLLGAEFVHLGLPDAIYRADASGRPISTHVPVHPDEERAFLPAVRARLELLLASEAARVFCPAGIGRQADHAIVRAAVEAVRPAGSIVYYEEYPYITRPDPGLPSGALPSHVTTLALSAEELEARVAAIACYRTQLRGLFPTRVERALEVLAAHTPAVGPLILGRADEEAVVRRAARCISEDARAVGERYRSCGSGPSPF